MGDLAERVRDLCLPIETEKRADGVLTRSVIVIPEFTCRDGCVHGSEQCRPGSGGYHGHGHRRLEFGVAVEGRGAVSFQLNTPILPDSVPEGRWQWTPLGPLNFHWPDPGPEYLRDLGWGSQECSYIGGRCWSDVTYLQADAGVEALLHGGVEGVWSWLAEAHLPTIMAKAA